jgi:tetratricopeptide (TPR) repeat protein
MALISIQNALDLEGENPYLLSLKGLAHFQYVNMGIKQKEHIVLATELANRALKLDPHSADANFTLGLIDILNGKVRDAVSKIEKALSIDPTNSDYLIWCAWFYMILGKPESAKFQLNKILKSDPLNRNIDIIEGPIACFEGQFESAAEICTRAYKNQPDNLLLLLFSSLSLAYPVKLKMQSIKLIKVF